MKKILVSFFIILLLVIVDPPYASAYVDAVVTRYNILTPAIAPGDKFEMDWWWQNTGTEPYTFYLGTSIQDPGGEWIVDVPYWKQTAQPNEEAYSHVWWITPTNAQEGTYKIRVAVWGGANGDILQNKFDSSDINQAFTINNAYKKTDVIPPVKLDELTSISINAVDDGPYERGERVVIQPMVTNRGLSQTFYLKLSVMDRYGTWWDAQSVPLTLLENQQGSLPISWKIPDDAASGWYTVKISAWSNGQEPHSLSGSQDMIDYVEIEKAFLVNPTINSQHSDEELLKCNVGSVLRDGICITEINIESQSESPTQDKKESLNKQGQCAIATAAFGTELAPQVQMLREVRDSVLLDTGSGIAFMTGFNDFYYTFSPTIADWERQSPLFKEVVKTGITPMLSTLSILKYIDINSEQEMLGYGIGIILLNIIAYLVIPVSLIISVKNLICTINKKNRPHSIF